MKKLEFKINISAPKQRVWETMLNAATYKEWAQAAWPGSFYEGTWAENEKIRFIGNQGSGTLALIKKYQPYDHIAATHIAALLPGGVEDTDSDLAKGWIGTKESYTFTEQDNHTNVVVEIITNPSWEEMFADGWPKALAKLKEICEAANK
jgi:uncharacterized protein YndB with AHSA1/START domain